MSCALDGSISVWEFWFERTTQSPKTQTEKSFFLSQQLNKEKLKTNDPKKLISKPRFLYSLLETLPSSPFKFSVAAWNLLWFWSFFLQIWLLKTIQICVKLSHYFFFFLKFRFLVAVVEDKTEATYWKSSFPYCQGVYLLTFLFLVIIQCV